jgi:magnesium-protoporphyrin O-methyltransferase
VVAIDLSPTLVELAKERLPSDLGKGHIDFLSGDMLDPALGEFDHVVCMDSLIHYDAPDIAKMLSGLADRTKGSIVFTHAPRTPLLTAMHAAGKFFPRGDRAPAIAPVANAKLRRILTDRAELAGWNVGRTRRIDSGFYLSQAQELKRG